MYKVTAPTYLAMGPSVIIIDLFKIKKKKNVLRKENTEAGPGPAPADLNKGLINIL